MDWLTKLERWFLKRILAKAVYGRNHEDHLKELYEMIYQESRRMFNEETVPGLFAFLDECYFHKFRRFPFFHPDSFKPMSDNNKSNDKQPTAIKAPPPLMVSRKDILGLFAAEAIRCSPYAVPEGLESAIRQLDSQLQPLFTVQHLSFRAALFHDVRELEQALKAAVRDIEEVTSWNMPKNTKHAGPRYVTRYNHAQPDDDFIDIDALLREAARAIWAESQRQADAINTPSVNLARALEQQHH